MMYNNFVGLLQIRQIQYNFYQNNYFHNPKIVGYFTMTINDLETFCNELYLFIHLLAQNIQCPS